MPEGRRRRAAGPGAPVVQAVGASPALRRYSSSCAVLAPVRATTRRPAAERTRLPYW